MLHDGGIGVPASTIDRSATSLDMDCASKIPALVSPLGEASIYSCRRMNARKDLHHSKRRGAWTSKQTAAKQQPHQLASRARQEQVGHVILDQHNPKPQIHECQHKRNKQQLRRDGQETNKHHHRERSLDFSVHKLSKTFIHQHIQSSKQRASHPCRSAHEVRAKILRRRQDGRKDSRSTQNEAPDLASVLSKLRINII
jgi:hypothetical protein